MDERTKEFLSEVTENLKYYFDDLSETGKEKMYPLLTKSIKNAIELIETIEDNPYLSYKDLAKMLGQNENTIKSRIAALNKGGFDIQVLGYSVSTNRGGRKRKLY
ncbi:MAG: winged helix-turn-helix transcriptional regulator [Cyanobacteria bacterium P01_A01_bin.80]